MMFVFSRPGNDKMPWDTWIFSVQKHWLPTQKKKKNSEILGLCSKTKALKMQKHGVLEVLTLELVANLRIKEIMLSIEYITQIKLDIWSSFI